MSWIECYIGEKPETFLVKRYRGQSYSGSVIVPKDMRITLFIDVDYQFLKNFNFKINDTSILTILQNNTESHYNRSGGYGYTITHFDISAGDTLSWNLGSSDYDFVLFNE